ncbi:MAG: glycosyltransferase family 2 protein [Nanoarchaeota archaeon]
MKPVNSRTQRVSTGVNLRTNVRAETSQKKPLLSIIIICDQLRLDKLSRLLESMKSQIEKYPAEILLLHESNIQRPAPSLPFSLRYLTIPAQQGIPFNRNQGLRAAQGELIVFIDDDCWVQEQWLDSLVRPLLQDQTLLAVTGGTRVPPSTFLGDCIAALGFPGGGSLGFEKVWKVSEHNFTNHLSVGNCALRRTVFEKVGYFDETMKNGAEDAEFSYRLERAQIPVKYVPEGYAYHEARTTWKEFVRWQLRRGRANYHFKKKVGTVKEFIKLRAWSAKNVLKENKNRRLPVIMTLLGMSAALQQIGYLQEKWKHE